MGMVENGDLECACFFQQEENMYGLYGVIGLDGLFSSMYKTYEMLIRL